VSLEGGIWQRSASSQTVPASYLGSLSDAVIDIFSLIGFVGHQRLKTAFHVYKECALRYLRFCNIKNTVSAIVQYFSGM
jgi:hypothetical protein